MPELLPLPHIRDRLIVVGTSVRKPLPIVKAYLQSLAWQELPPRTKVHYVFVPDWPEQNTDAEHFLKVWVEERGGELLRGAPKAVGDFVDGPGIATHQWGETAMRRVGENKNRIFKRAQALQADAVFLADADLILDRTVLASLIAIEKPVACAVYWTHWNRPTTETGAYFSGPQVWLNHPYEQEGRGYDQAGFRAALLSRGITQVWGQGACTLIDRKVIDGGIDFTPVPGPPGQGLMNGEDRHFCMRATAAHIPMHADSWPDIFHIYHAPEDVERIPSALEVLGREHPTHAKLGDLISVKLEALEPVPNPNGWQHVAPHIARGRLGQLPLMPEIEEALYEVPRGGQRILKVHCSLAHPMPFYRGRVRLFRVTLLDVKPFGFPPVVSEELVPGEHSGAFLDQRALTEPQRASVANG